MSLTGAETPSQPGCKAHKIGLRTNGLNVANTADVGARMVAICGVDASVSLLPVTLRGLRCQLRHSKWTCGAWLLFCRNCTHALDAVSPFAAMSTAAASLPAACSAAPAGSPTDAQRAFWQDSLATHSSSLLQTMLLHDDEAEADAMNKGEIEEIFAMCRIQKDWTVCGQ